MPFFASSPIKANTVCDFPDPDSPTIPNVSPGFSEKVRSLTAVTLPSCVVNSTRKSFTSNKFILFPLSVFRIKCVTKTITDVVKAE